MWGLRQCSILNDTFDILNIIMAVSAGAIVYLAYQSKTKHINQFLYLIPVLVIFLAIMTLFSLEITF
jgi:hypothetical protein